MLSMKKQPLVVFYLCQSDLFLIKVQAWSLQLYKRDSDIGVLLLIMQNF